MLKLIKFRKDSNFYIPNPPALTARIHQILENPVEKCVSVDVLAEPEPGTPIRVDVIFIHGLHGKSNDFSQIFAIIFYIKTIYLHLPSLEDAYFIDYF